MRLYVLMKKGGLEGYVAGLTYRITIDWQITLFFTAWMRDEWGHSKGRRHVPPSSWYGHIIVLL
jgi:hypothetical protein